MNDSPCDVHLPNCATYRCVPSGRSYHSISDPNMLATHRQRQGIANVIKNTLSPVNIKNENIMSYWISRVFRSYCSAVWFQKPSTNGNHVNALKCHWNTREKTASPIKHMQCACERRNARDAEGCRQPHYNWNVFLFNKYLALFMAIYVFILNRSLFVWFSFFLIVYLLASLSLCRSKDG